MTKTIYILAILALCGSIFPAVVFSEEGDTPEDVKNREHGGAMPATPDVCARGKTLDSVLKSLDSDDRDELLGQNGEDMDMIHSESIKKSGYYVGYVYRIVPNVKPEIVMGVYSQCDKHRGSSGLGSFILKSQYRDMTDMTKKVTASDIGNPFRVFYEQKASGYDNGRYITQNTVKKVGDGGYILESKGIWSNNEAAMAPYQQDGYVKVVPYGANGSFVIACNYIEPSMYHKDKDSYPEKVAFRAFAKSRLKASGENLYRNVMREIGSADHGESARRFLERLVP